MSIIKSEDGKKWINAFIAGVSILVGFVTIRFIGQLSEWFDLEAKVGNFLVFSQGLGVLLGLITFIAITKNKKALQHMQEVYGELLKVVWPESDAVVKVTVGIVIGVSIISGLFVLIDFLSQELLSLVY
ncbi:MAG: preprotein translocase subunit SecE [Bdellovibrionales bacterium]|jgi:preprotein translocase subunit SecE|nr:preprotein translocase subunit SecE [Bdellovibrionales bacterium]